MKIIRFLAVDGKVYWGTLKDDQSNAAIIEGDILSEWKIGKHTTTIARVLAPIMPANIVALGLNYKKHAEETGIPYPEIPVIFLKGTNTVIGDGEDIELPNAGPHEVDYEAELAIIISRKAKNLRREEVLDHILGYACANDVSARDWQIYKQKKQWARGKSFDTFCPLGPWIVTKDEIENPDDLGIRCILNGKVMQDANTSDMCFDVKTIISEISLSMTLLPGTVILTGTPEGVGFTRKPPVYLKAGDRVEIEIDKIGRLANNVVCEKV